MRTIFLAFANAEAAAKVKSVLVSAGLPMGRVCMTGAALLQQAMLEPAGGVAIVPPRLSDMSVPDLLSRLPDTFDIVVLHGKGQPAGFGQLPGLTFVETPLPAADLVDTVRSLLETRTVGGRKYRPASARPGQAPGRPGHAPAGGGRDTYAAPQRSPVEERQLREAKEYLITRCGLTEEQAHRNLQKRSMESGTRLAEIARRVLEEAAERDRGG